MDDKDIDNSLKWNKRSGIRVVIEFFSVIGPFLCVIFISWLVYYLVSGPHENAYTNKPVYTYPFVCERFFSTPEVIPLNYYPFLTTGFKWGHLKVKIPDYWIYFTDKRYGGQTLTLQPAESSMFGIHIQVLNDKKENMDLSKYGRNFIGKIGYGNFFEHQIKFLRTKAYCFDVFYLASGAVPMTSQFIFMKKNKSLIRIIIFAPNYIFKHRLSLFYAVIDSLEYSG